HPCHAFDLRGYHTASVVVATPNSEPNEHPLKVSSVHARTFCGPGHVAVRSLEQRARVEALEPIAPHLSGFFERHVDGEKRLDAGRKRHLCAVAPSARFLPADRDAALDEVPELAHVARPAPREERRRDLGGQRAGLTAEALVEVLREKGDVLASRTKRRHLELDHREPVVKVFATWSIADALREPS